METQTTNVSLTIAKGVDAVKLERELAAMWGGDEQKPEVGVTRACALNLIVYSESNDDRDEMDELLGTVVQRHPCRAIVLHADRQSSTPTLEALVSTRCQLGGRGSKKVCGEQITIEAAGSILDTLSTAVSPLLVPDVPVFLWWKDIPHYEDKLFNRLAALSDRVVIDSASFDNPHDDIVQLARILDQNKEGARYSDLNWSRLTTWRSLVASFWDVADYRASLDRLERIVIEYDRPDKSPSEVAPKALLALGWIGSRLGWTVESAEIGDAKALFALSDRGRAVVAQLLGTEDTKGRDGFIVSISLVAEDGNEFFVRLRPLEAKLETGTKLSGHDHHVGRILNYEARSEGERLNGELDIVARDDIFEASVRFISSLLEKA